MEKENNGCITETTEIPICLFYNTFKGIFELENNANVLLLYIAYCSFSFWEEGTDSIDFMCQKTKLSKSQFIQAKKELKKLGLIEKTETGLLIHYFI